MKERGGEDGAGAAGFDGVTEVFGAARTAGGDDADLYGAGDGAQEVEIEAAVRAVAIDRREQDLASPELLGAPAPFEGVDVGDFAASANGGKAAFRVAREHDRLHAELSCTSRNQRGVA